MNIMIDLDNVICFSGRLNMINEFLSSNYSYEDARGYFLQDLIPTEKQKEFVEWYKTKNQYDYAELLDNSVEVIELLNTKFNIYICSDYIFRDNIEFSGNIAKNKFVFITKHLPFLNPKNIIFLAKKSLLNCDVKIDDSIDNLEGAKHKFLFNAFHNQDISNHELVEKGIIRVNNWLELKEILSKI
jgi:Uncharacterized protein conserved in bacteria